MVVCYIFVIAMVISKQNLYIFLFLSTLLILIVTIIIISLITYKYILIIIQLAFTQIYYIYSSIQIPHTIRLPYPTFERVSYTYCFRLWFHSLYSPWVSMTNFGIEPYFTVWKIYSLEFANINSFSHWI